jgi:hypothetical protein
MSSPRRKNRISGQFSVRLIEMLESPAYGALSLSGHKVISRLEIELAHHGGNDNGKLPVTYQNFVDFGVTRECVAPATRETVALGFVEITRQGRGGNAEFREPSLYRLTYSHARDSRQRPPTDEWRKIKTSEEANVIAKAARANQSPAAVLNGKRNRNRHGKPTPEPVSKTHTENEESPVRKTRTTGSVGKPVLLSISRGGGDLE